MVAGPAGKKLYVDTSMKAGVADHIATDTIKAYNTFLERATGLTAKERRDRKSTRLNSSHLVISYAVFCLKKKNLGKPDSHGPNEPPAPARSDARLAASRCPE